ncbi:uncharacterized protein LOC124693393 [Lolium rigidum]|uniref:uncharacterized protein LOC124693393 n=1 Tax=Lolium rigidum TaxID=89674 RepID=UPI001F5DF059|nr:uncharacterized protein LOC124693393 [Lolium rigidum]
MASCHHRRRDRSMMGTKLCSSWSSKRGPGGWRDGWAQPRRFTPTPLLWRWRAAEKELVVACQAAAAGVHAEQKLLSFLTCNSNLPLATSPTCYCCHHAKGLRLYDDSSCPDTRGSKVCLVLSDQDGDDDAQRDPTVLDPAVLLLYWQLPSVACRKQLLHDTIMLPSRCMRVPTCPWTQAQQSGASGLRWVQRRHGAAIPDIRVRPWSGRRPVQGPGAHYR